MRRRRQHQQSELHAEVRSSQPGQHGKPARLRPEAGLDLQDRSLLAHHGIPTQCGLLQSVQHGELRSAAERVNRRSDGNAWFDQWNDARHPNHQPRRSGYRRIQPGRAARNGVRLEHKLLTSIWICSPLRLYQSLQVCGWQARALQHVRVRTHAWLQAAAADRLVRISTRRVRRLTRTRQLPLSDRQWRTARFLEEVGGQPDALRVCRKSLLTEVSKSQVLRAISWKIGLCRNYI